MDKKHLLIPSAIAIAIALNSAPVLAAGFQLNAQSATGLGRAFAGDAVIADNASAIARNPATMALFDAPAISLGVIAIDTDVTVKDASYKGFMVPNSIQLPDEKIGGTSYAPNLYYIHPINKTFSLGMALYSNFGTKTEFSDNYAANEFGGLSDLKTMNAGVSGSFRLNDQFSFGLGLDFITGTGKLKRFNSNIPIIGNDLINVDAEGTGWGWNAGVVYELNKDHRFGLSYRHSPDIDTHGDSMISKGQQLKGDLTIRLPDMAEFSGFHQLSNQFAVHYSIQWIEWATFDKLATTSNEVLNDYNWQDGMHYSIGGTYFLNNEWTLRAGYMYDTSAQDQKTSISVPDSDRQWLSTGFNYKITKKSSLDFGLTYLVGKNTQVNETNPLKTRIQATTRANAFLYGFQYNYSF